MSSTTLDPAPPRRSWTSLIGVPVAAVSLAGLVACGTGAAGATTSSSTGSGAQAGTSGTAMAAFASCLADNGVTLPERGSDGGSPPTGAPPAGGTGGSGSGGAAAPGGTAAGGAGGPGAGSGGAAAGSGQAGGAMAAPPGVDATTWASAQKACAQYAPTPPSGANTAG